MSLEIENMEQIIMGSNGKLYHKNQDLCFLSVTRSAL